MGTSKTIGKFAYITDKESIYYQEWGEIVAVEDGLYHIAIAQGKDNIPVFDRDQFKIPQRQWLRNHADLIKIRNAIV